MGSTAWVVIGGIVVLAGIGSVFGSDDGASNQVDQGGAVSACEDWVTDELKAPSTADFSDETTTGSNPWNVTGSVDAQNGFGAQIRTGWICHIKLRDGVYRGNATLLE